VKRPAARASITCRATGLQVALHLVERADDVGLVARGEVALLRRDGQVLDRAALGDPLGQAAVQHHHVLVAHGAEFPPDAGGGQDAAGVVDDDLRAVAQAQLLDPRGELDRRGQHVRQVRGLVRDLVDVEEHRAWNVGQVVLGPGVALGGGHVPGAVDDPDVRRVEVLGQPGGRDERIGMGHDKPFGV
jgi:hypothetical protein